MHGCRRTSTAVAGEAAFWLAIPKDRFVHTASRGLGPRFVNASDLTPTQWPPCRIVADTTGHRRSTVCCHFGSFMNPSGAARRRLCTFRNQLTPKVYKRCRARCRMSRKNPGAPLLFMRLARRMQFCDAPCKAHDFVMRLASRRRSIWFWWLRRILPHGAEAGPTQLDTADPPLTAVDVRL